LQRYLPDDSQIKKGLTEYIVDPSLSVSDVVSTSSSNENLSIVLSGVIPPNPAELLMEKRTKEFFDEIRELYDYVVVDTAPSAAGYFTDPVQEGIVGEERRLTFSVSGGGGTVTLQYMGAGETVWQDEGDYEAGAAKRIDATSRDRQWRSICKETNWADTGDLIYGIEW
jgi:hypothetical protein